MKVKRNRSSSKAKKGMELGTFCTLDDDTLVLNVLGTPAAKRDAIGRVRGKQLCISVTEKPVRGQATDHMVRFLAEKFCVAVSDIEVVFGRYNVNKQLRIRAPQRLPAVIARHLAVLKENAGE